jgi:hypothetical protein
MVFVCDRGCEVDGRPTRHANEGACPVIRAERQAAKTSIVKDRKTPPGTDPSPPPTKAPAEPAKPKGTWDSLVEFFHEPAKTVAAPNVPEAQQSYLLDGDDVVRVVQTFLSIIEFAINLFMRYMGGATLPEDLCDVTKSKASSFLVSRNLRHTVSQLFISAGVKSKGEAQALIGEAEGVVALGHIVGGIAYHLMTELPKSKRWKEWFPDKPGAASGLPDISGGTKPGQPWWDLLGISGSLGMNKTSTAASTAHVAPT